MNEPNPPFYHLGSQIFLIVVGIGTVFLLARVTYHAWIDADTNMEQVATEFLNAVAEDDLEQAYALTSPGVQSSLPFESFQEKIEGQRILGKAADAKLERIGGSGKSRIATHAILTGAGPVLLETEIREVKRANWRVWGLVIDGRTVFEGSDS